MPASSAETAVGTALRVALAANKNSAARGDPGVSRSGDMRGDPGTASSLLMAGGATKRALLADVEFKSDGNFQSGNTATYLEGCKDYVVVLKGTTNNSIVNKPEDEEEDDNELAASGSDSSCGSTGGETPKKPSEASYELFPASRVRLGWRPNNCNKKSCNTMGNGCGCGNSVRTNWHAGCGMTNMGNTCYMNSILQALFHVPAFVNWLRWDEEEEQHAASEPGCNCVICAMRRTLIESQLQSGISFRPHLIYDKLRTINRTFLPGEQEDAHEFLRYLIESMEKTYVRRRRRNNHDAAAQPQAAAASPRLEETTPLNRIFGGYLRTAVTCLRCGHVSRTNRHYFEDLLLDVVRPKLGGVAATNGVGLGGVGGTSSVEEAMDAYFAVEKLEVAGVGDSASAYRCESCGRKVPATKQFSIEQPPPVLCVQLKRFSSTSCKYTRHVSFRMRLDATPYVIDARKRQRAQVPLLYRLCAVVTHVGPTVGCGHYTAVARAPNGSFYLFDDSVVRQISHQAVLQTNAYIIMYELESPIPPNLPKGHISNGIPKPDMPNLTISVNKAEKRKLEEPQVQSQQQMIQKTLKINGNAVKNGNNENGKKIANSEGEFNSSYVSNGMKRVKLEQNNRSIFDPESTTPITPTTATTRNDQEPIESPPSLSSLSSPEHLETKTSKNSSTISESKQQNEDSSKSLVPYSTNDSSSSEDSSNEEEKLKLKLQNGKNQEHQDQRFQGQSGSALPELLKMSHGGYSAPVASWSGNRSKLDRAVADERRKERNENGRDDEDEVERRRRGKNWGGGNAAGKSNPGYNPVQEFHANLNRNHYRNNQDGRNNNVFRKKHHHYHDRHHFHHRRDRRNFKNFKDNRKNNKFRYNRK